MQGAWPSAVVMLLPGAVHCLGGELGRGAAVSVLARSFSRMGWVSPWRGAVWRGCCCSQPSRKRTGPRRDPPLAPPPTGRPAASETPKARGQSVNTGMGRAFWHLQEWARNVGRRRRARDVLATHQEAQREGGASLRAPRGNTQCCSKSVHDSTAILYVIRLSGKGSPPQKAEPAQGCWVSHQVVVSPGPPAFGETPIFE